MRCTEQLDDEKDEISMGSDNRLVFVCLCIISLLSTSGNPLKVASAGATCVHVDFVPLDLTP